MLRKIFCSIVLYTLSYNFFPFSFSDLVEAALQNNSDIASAKSDYDSALLSSKTYDSSFAPGLSFSSSSTISKDYDWNTNPDYFSTYVTYTQPLPGGTTLSATGTYSFTSASAGDDQYISQIPKVSFTLSQSLLPFWTQGTIKDPTVLSARQQAEYYRLQLLYTKKSVLQNLIQNYAYALIDKNKIQIYRNSVCLAEEQIEALKKLKSSGSTSQAKITELESSKWGYEEDLMSVQASYCSYLQNLKSMCGCEIDDIENTLVAPEKNILEEILISDSMNSIYHIKLQMLETKRIFKIQNSAPTLNLTIQSSWTLENVKNNDWQDAWKNGDNPSWTATVSMDFSPLLRSTMSKDKKHYEIDYQQAEKSYENYLLQKKFVNEQYELLYKNYSSQLESIEKLFDEGKIELNDYEKLYNAGDISKLDFDSVKTKVDNCEFSNKLLPFQSVYFTPPFYNVFIFFISKFIPFL